MALVVARFVSNDCGHCLAALLVEAKSHGGFALEGAVAEIPDHWLNAKCPHGRTGLRFDLVADELSAESEAELETESQGGWEDCPFGSSIDATKNIGFPVREHGPYGSHPMHDDFDDESGPDGSGLY